MFGPILSVVRADDIDGAMKVLNASTYGNAASIFTSSGAAAQCNRYRCQSGAS